LICAKNVCTRVIINKKHTENFLENLTFCQATLQGGVEPVSKED
jgi:hypothetical protein